MSAQRASHLETAGRGPAGVWSLGLIATTVFVGTFAYLASTTSYDTWGGLLLAAILLAITLPFLHRQAVREDDTALFWILTAALLLKLGGAVAREFVAFDLYGGSADAAVYHSYGVQISENFRQGIFETGLRNFTDTNFIRLFTGIVYTVTGPTKLGGFVVYSWLGFIGMFLFYRGFTIAVPEGRNRTYALFVFFLPSLLFWPSSIGKEAWMMFTLGIAAFGAARILSGRTWRGLLIAGVGLFLAGMVRPHVAGLVGVALAVGGLLRRPRTDLRELAPIARILGLAALAAVAVVMVVWTNSFLANQGLNPEEGLTTVLEGVAEQTGTGGSQFAPAISLSPAQAPLGAFTVLFRPLLYEATSAQAALAALESSFLLLLTVVRIRWIWTAIRSVRRQPYVAFAIAYSLLFMIAFSAVANFGILARQRVQLLPFYLVLLAIPPIAKRAEREPDANVAPPT